MNKEKISEKDIEEVSGGMRHLKPEFSVRCLQCGKMFMGWDNHDDLCHDCLEDFLDSISAKPEKSE